MPDAFLEATLPNLSPIYWDKHWDWTEAGLFKILAIWLWLWHVFIYILKYHTLLMFSAYVH